MTSLPNSWDGAKVGGAMMSKRLVCNLMCRVVAGLSASEYYNDFTALCEAGF